MAKQAQYLPLSNNGDDIQDVFETFVEDDKGKKTSQKARLEDIIEQLNNIDDDVTMSVYKQSALGGKSSMAFCESFPVDKYSYDDLLTYLKVKYRGGDFRVHVRQGGKIIANRLVNIEPDATETADRRPTSEAGEVLNVVMAAIDKQNQMLMATLQQQPTETDMLQKMMMYKQLFDNGSSSNGLGHLNEAISTLKSLGIEIGGPTQDDDSFGKIAEKLIPLAQSAMSQSQPQSPKPNPAPRNVRGKDTMLLKIKMGLQTLIRAASTGQDPAFYAEFIIQQFKPEVISDFILGPNAFDRMTQLNANVTQYKDWFTDLAEHIKAHFGMESKFEDFYDDLPATQESVINAESDDDGKSGGEVHPT